jgi:hypothetical protein
MRRSTSFCPFGPFLLFSHTPAPHRHLQRPSCCPALATKAVDPECPHSTTPLLMLSTHRLDAATACGNHPTITSKNRAAPPLHHSDGWPSNLSLACSLLGRGTTQRPRLNYRRAVLRVGHCRHAGTGSPGARPEKGCARGWLGA